MKYMYNCNVQTPELICGLSNFDPIYDFYGHKLVITAYNLAMGNICRFTNDRRYDIEELIGNGVWNGLNGHTQDAYLSMISWLANNGYLPLEIHDAGDGEPMFQRYDFAEHHTVRPPSSWPYTDEQWIPLSDDEPEEPHYVQDMDARAVA